MEAREKADFHSELSAGVDLNQVFCLEQERKVSNDWVLQYGICWLQIDEQQKTPVSAGDQVVIREHRDGALTLLFKGKVLKWHELAERPSKLAVLPKRRVVTRPKPTSQHPWRQRILSELER